MASNYGSNLGANRSEISSTTTGAPNRTCVVSSFGFLIADMAMSSTAFFIQFFLFFSLMVYRKKLLQNLIYVYAANVVFANFAFSLVTSLLSYLNYFGYTREPNGYQKTPLAFRSFWFFLQALVLVLFLVICLAIGLLTMAVKNNVFRLHRTIAGVDQSRGNDTNDLIKNGKKRKRVGAWIKTNPKCFAAVLIVLVWLIPILLSFLTFSDLHCLKTCFCLVNYSPLKNPFQKCPTGQGCHMLWAGFSLITIRTASGTWMVCAILVGVLFARSYYNFRVILDKRRRARKSQINAMNDVCAVPENGTEKSVEDKLPDRPPKEKVKRSNKRSRESDCSSSPLIKSLKNSLFHDFVVAIIFLCGSAPPVFLAFTTSFPSGASVLLTNPTIIIPFIVLPQIAYLINSIVLCSVHPGLKSAVMTFMRSISSCSCLRKKH